MQISGDNNYYHVTNTLPYSQKPSTVMSLTFDFDIDVFSYYLKLATFDSQYWEHDYTTFYLHHTRLILSITS